MEKNIVDYLLDLLEKKGSNMIYGGENVSQLEHALQCAELAEENRLPNPTIVAALLHDIGHLLYEDKDPIHEGKDGHHENLGANYLSKYFGEEVINPIRAHVDSKKYLAAVEDKYHDFLSEASQISLAAQGGPFSKEEAEEFIKKPFMKEAVEMRRFDDMAKIVNKKTPDLNHFKHYLDEAFQSFYLKNN
jgi:phosphonate degradation associated HDIG domain protein